MVPSEPNQMSEKKTHREIKTPQISLRFLADYMEASQLAARTIARSCKYQPIARVVQHDAAKAATSKLIRDGAMEVFKARSQQLRNRLAADDFERNVLDVNADYIDRVAEVYASPPIGSAELQAPGKTSTLELNGVRVSVELAFRASRVTKTNKIRVGGGALRYAKGKVLPDEVAAWQSAFIFGFLGLVPPEDGAEPEHKLCLVLDAYAGKWHYAPTDALRRFRNMEAACASIAERWANIQPPPGAVL
jgi:hypothetical protein